MEHVRQFTVVGKKLETTDSVTLTLQPVDGLPFTYQPGQYLSFVFQSATGDQRRAYSFSTCVGVDALPQVTVKRVVNGAYSTQLVRETEVGDTVFAAGPSGLFTLPKPLPSTIIYLCAGSGITPVMSHLKYLLEVETNAKPHIVLFYANRTAAQTIFKKQLDTLAAAHPDRFTLIYIFSRESGEKQALHGHMNNALFEQLLKKHVGASRIRRGAMAYLCAPTALIRMGAMTLRLLDMPDENIRREVFVPDNRLTLRTVDKSKTHTIRLSGNPEPISFETYEGETILNAALRQGIALPYTCKSGVCFTCLAKCIKGEVDVAFFDAVKREGPGQMVNTCIGYAVSKEVEIAVSG
ncbi:MAG: ferredoxin--NADP reductase [Saprospiraceae bacterium]|nr:ferredoxin--NADP reductase [Saprospiraceae bacterium]